jgi:branched-chain amino acid transport system permease protein
MEYWIGVFIIVGITIISVLGVAVLTGFTGLFSFGHAGFMAIGAYTSAILVKSFGIPIWLGVIIGMLASVLVGVMIGYPTLRLKGDYFLIATLGFGEVVKLVIENMQSITGGAMGLPDIPGKITLPVILALDALAILLVYFFVHSRQGRNCIAIREEETAAEVMGINVTKYKILSMAFSCALTGFSGALLAHYMHYLQPVLFSTVKSQELIITVIMGGMGSISGPVLAAIILTPLPELLRVSSAQEWRMVIYGFIVILIVMFRPSGLFGYREINFKFLQKAFANLAGRKAKGA